MYGFRICGKLIMIAERCANTHKSFAHIHIDNFEHAIHATWPETIKKHAIFKDIEQEKALSVEKQGYKAPNVLSAPVSAQWLDVSCVVSPCAVWCCVL